MRVAVILLLVTATFLRIECKPAEAAAVVTISVDGSQALHTVDPLYVNFNVSAASVEHQSCQDERGEKPGRGNLRWGKPALG